MPSLSRNVISHASSTALGSLVQFLLIILLARFFEIDEFGKYTAIAAVIALAEITADFGLRVIVVQHYSLSGEKKQQDLFTHSILIKTIIFVILCTVMLVANWDLLTTNELILGVLIACLQPSTDPYIWFLRGAERLDIEAKILIIWRIVNALLLAGLAFFNFDLIYLLWAWLFSNLLRMTIEKWVCNKIIPDSINALRIQFSLFKRDELFSLFKIIFPIGLSLVFMAVYIRMNLFIIGYLGNATDVAHYGAAFSIAISTGFVATSVTMSIFPSLVRAIETKAFTKATLIAHKKLNMISILMGIACFLGIALSTWIIGILFPAEYSKSSRIMIWLFPGLYLSTINFGLKYLFNALKLNRKEIVSVIFGMSTLLLLIFIFYPKSESIIILAAIAWSFSELIMFASKIYLMQKHSPLKIRLSNVSTYFIFFCLLMYFAYFIQS